MKRGDRVVTPMGRTGTVHGTRTDRSWGLSRRPIVRVWVVVELDENDDGARRVYVAPQDLRPLEAS